MRIRNDPVTVIASPKRDATGVNALGRCCGRISLSQETCLFSTKVLAEDEKSLFGKPVVDLFFHNTDVFCIGITQAFSEKSFWVGRMRVRPFLFPATEVTVL